MGASKAVLVVKAGEYAGGGDRLHNFKKSAILVDGTPEQALWGFITKHLVSLSDMVYSGKDYPTAVWDEKIGDSLNYLILLRALIEEKRTETEDAGQDAPDELPADFVINGNEWFHYCPESEDKEPLRLIVLPYMRCDNCGTNAPKIEVGAQ